MSKKPVVFTPEKFFCIIAALVLLVSLTGCFSPWTGNEGSVTINLGGRDAVGRWAIDYYQHEEDSFEHEIILKGPGGTITKTVKGAGTLSIQLSSGTWKLVVRAMGDQPNIYGSFPGYLFPPRMLRAIGIDTAVKVKSGENTQVQLQMYPAIEVSNWTQLDSALSNVSYEEFIVLTDNIEMENAVSPTPENTVTIIADRPVKLTRGSVGGSLHDGYFFNVINGSTLILGHPGMEGSITLDGKGASYYPLIGVNGAYLEMHDGVNLNNNYITDNGGGVEVINSGTFTMYGGNISGNEAYGGGAIFVDMAEFTMHGGSLSANKAEKGGAVYVESGTFIMNGGIIGGTTAAGKNESADMGGGGVYLLGGEFTMNGGSIINNEDLGTVFGGGAVYVDTGTFTMSGGTIGANTAANKGGGVYISAIAEFTKHGSGGIIYGIDGGENANIANANTPPKGHAAYYDNGLGLCRDTTVGKTEPLNTSGMGWDN